MDKKAIIKSIDHMVITTPPIMAKVGVKPQKKLKTLQILQHIEIQIRLSQNGMSGFFVSSV